LSYRICGLRKKEGDEVRLDRARELGYRPEEIPQRANVKVSVETLAGKITVEVSARDLAEQFWTDLDDVAHSAAEERMTEQDAAAKLLRAGKFWASGGVLIPNPGAAVALLFGNFWNVTIEREEG